ncbi:MAG: hypothetical protein EKK40_03610 [Bradyrhizobiaceae bacterium]|nr:MAG: hypothetical protein EKK40_03610 [Bradyrhizobiaceae bacterium]
MRHIDLPTRFTVAVAAVVGALCFAQPAVSAQGTKVLRAGDVLSGPLTVLRMGHKKNRTITYQLTSEPRRLPPPSGLCDLETGPETFQIVTSSDADINELKPYVGKNVSIKANEISCAQAAGEVSDALVTKWSVVKQ